MVASPGRVVEGRFSAHGQAVYFCAVSHEQFDDFPVPLAGRAVQRHPSTFVFAICIHPAIQMQPDRFDVPNPRSLP